VFSDPHTQRLWHAGEIRAAYEHSASTMVAPPVSEHPFRDAGASLEAARRWHEHGILCWHAARFPECQTVLDRAHAARKQALGAEHPDTLATLERQAALAHYLFADDDRSKFDDVVGRLVRVFGEDHLRVAIARRNYATCIRDRDRPDAARGMLELARPVIERDLPTDHPDVVALYKVDAMLAIAEDRLAEAIVIAERAIRVGTLVWHGDHPFVAAAALTLATAEAEQGYDKRAVKRLIDVHRLFVRAYGRHPLTAIALHRHAQCELALGRNFERAEQLVRRAIAMYGETYPGRQLAFVQTLFDILFESRRVLEAGELAFELDDAPRWMQLDMTSKVANYLAALRDFGTALPFAERARDLCDDAEIRGEWADRVEYLVDQLPPGPDRDT
jgi:tetratricopeptide (TPR) repeat protein